MMKKLLVLSVVVFSLAFSFKAKSQEVDWCGTTKHEQMLTQNHPERINQFRQLQELIQNSYDSIINTTKDGKEQAVVITIPVVFHILHDDWEGNISDAQVKDAIRIINEDFSKTNPDTNLTRSIYKPYAADCEIQFKLAKLDPDGNCTTGITRSNTPLTNGANDECKSVIHWSSEKYFNIWVVNYINLKGKNGTVLGYAQFPWGSNKPSSWKTYGVVIKNDRVGSIGTSVGDGRTLTHEIGHCFGLEHTFEGGCGQDCSTSGDYVCDTPPVKKAIFGCDTTENSCSNDTIGSSLFSSDMPDQIENYMGYNHSCQNMFTLGQKTRMRELITKYIYYLQKLTTDSNLIATGTNSGYVAQTCKPKAAFGWDRKIICLGEKVKYTKESNKGEASTWQWTFQGGTPSTSTDTNVTVTYNTPGKYNTTLSVNNSAGSDTVSKRTVIVSGTTADYTNWIYQEDFEDSTLFMNDWVVVNPNSMTPWKRTTATSSSGSASIFINNKTNDNKGQKNAIISPSFDFNAVNQPILTFKLAFAQKNSSNNDRLSVYFSTDCGKNWQLRYAKYGSSLSTSANTSSNFIPEDIQWRTESVFITNQLMQKNVRVKFEFISGGGNNIYIDDINISSTTGINKIELEKNSFNLYPNPTDEFVNIEFNLLKPTKHLSLRLIDVFGREISTLFDDANLAKGKHNSQLNLKNLDLPKGLYFIQLEKNKNISLTKKLIIK